MIALVDVPIFCVFFYVLCGQGFPITAITRDSGDHGDLPRLDTCASPT